MLIWGGGAERLLDGINEFGKKMKASNPSTEVVIQPGAAHDDFIADAILNAGTKAEGTKVIESWMVQRL